MSHTYKIVEIVGASLNSWEEAAANALTTASNHLKDLRVAEVMRMDIHVLDTGQLEYRTRLQVSFKYHGEDAAG